MDFRLCCFFLALLASVAQAVPVFLAPNQAVSALEHYPVGQIIVGVSVYDTVPLSLTDNDIVFSDASGLFRTDIQGNNILIEVARPLLVGEVTVTVTLVVTGAVATVRITVLQTNFPPIFSDDLYQESIDEDAAVGYTVATVVAFDYAPLNANDSVFEYRFEDPTSLPKFSIDPSTGDITLLMTVDYEAGETDFVFTVVAQETLSTSMLSATSEVEVTVNNVNDNSPQLRDTPYHYTIPENSGEALREADDGTDIITATDGDIGTFGDVTYTLSGSTLFDIDVTDAGAQLKTTGDLDREGIVSYSLTLVATDTGGLSDSVGIEVTVEDVNDNPPVITNNPMTSDVEILECAMPGMLLSTVNAEDTIDSGDFAEVAFTEVPGGDSNHIVLNQVSGELHLGVAPIDYDAPTNDRSFTLSVKAVDYPEGPVANQLESGETFVQTITIMDCNDNPPVFGQLTYSFTVTENMADLSGPTITTTDGDGTEANKAVTYAINGQVPGNWFSIAADGTLSISSGAVVDREHEGVLTDSQGRGVVTFSIEATNVGTSTTLSSAQDAQVVVTISDQNDNAPVMDETPLTGTRDIVVVEDVTVGTVLAVVRATDPDIGDNAEILYEITSGNDLGKFSLDGTNGVLTLAQTIDFEMEGRAYTLTITATNPPPAPAPPPSDDDDIVLTIMIEGANEHAPIFSSSRYEEEIHEYNVLVTTQQHMAGETIATVSATDADASDVIQYSITGGNDDDIFEIPNPLFGSITLKRPMVVDFETTTSYALVITATDLVVPASDRKTNTTYLYITVVDENDNLPVFSSDVYTGHVDEEQSPGTSVILTRPIAVSDADSLGGTETAMFEITTVGSPLPNPFLAFTLSVDGTSLTTTTHNIDREMDGNVFTFQLKVFDSGNNEDTAMVIINITDINDNPPIVQQPPGGFLITVPENNPVDSVITNITAEDKDIGANAQFLFTLQGGAGYFDIDHETGVITQVASLQALEPPMLFSLTVIARDSGGLSSDAVVTVNLTYANDHAPVFDTPVYSGSVPECAEDGTSISPVITLRATDDDSDSVISYYIEDSPTGNLFRLNHRGQVADMVSAGVYDRETTDTYIFTVFATDGILGTEDASATVTITITDCNDHSPIFTQELYDVDVPEGTASGATVIQVHTNDGDIGENAEVDFTIESVEPPSYAAVFSVVGTGGIVTNVDIDNTYTGSSTCSNILQHSNNVTLTIKATDRATQQSQLSNYTTVFIRLLDRNSEAPSFTPSSFYSFDILENVQGVVLGTVEAVDECDANSAVMYSLVSGEDSDPFEIDENTGVISVKSKLDREENDLLVIQLQAMDDGTDPGPQTGYASVTINVLDENDNAPVLVRDMFEVSHPENIQVGTTLISLLASDPDLSENGTINFTMVGDDTLFMLEGSDMLREGSGSTHLVTKSQLDRETLSSHVVTVLVEDTGDPPERTTAVMTLTLEDVNDNEPVWTSGHGTQFDIFENVTDYLVVDLDATDADAGLNQELVYYFVGGSQDSGPFTIDRDDGSLTIVGDLDYETTQEYSLTIVVSDRMGETVDDGLTPLTNSTTILITVRDVNDNLPFFNRCPHEYEILETRGKGWVVGSDIRNSVVDKDSLAIQTPFYYYIDSLEDVKCYRVFCIDMNTGEITLDSAVDFEMTSSYTFYVVVSDRPNLTPEEVYSSPRIDLCDTVATKESNITRVDVALTDVNDQRPVFDPDSLLGAVAEEAEFDTTVTVLRAFDTDDNDTFSTVYYEIIAVDPPYLVNRDTGEVTTADTFTGRSGEIDRFTVVAYDNEGNEPSYTSTAILTIRVFKECEQIVAVADQTREEAEECRSQLETAIANQTGYIIYITKIRVHQNEEQNVVDTTKADMIFYALHHTSGDLVPPAEVIGIIERGLDLQQEPIRSLVQNCKTSNFKQFCTSGSESSASSGVSTAIGVSMGLLAAIILALLICLICVCALERRKARKLRLRKKRPMDHSLSQFSQLATSNPMWMPPYDQWEEESTTTANQSALDRDNPLYESQELTIEMFKDPDEDDMLSVASSRGNPSKIKPPRRSSTPGGRDSAYDPLADALGLSGEPEDSQTSLI